MLIVHTCRVTAWFFFLPTRCPTLACTAPLTAHNSHLWQPRVGGLCLSTALWRQRGHVQFLTLSSRAAAPLLPVAAWTPPGHGHQRRAAGLLPSWLLIQLFSSVLYTPGTSFGLLYSLKYESLPDISATYLVLPMCQTQFRKTIPNIVILNVKVPKDRNP